MAIVSYVELSTHLSTMRDNESSEVSSTPYRPCSYHSPFYVEMSTSSNQLGRKATNRTSIRWQLPGRLGACACLHATAISDKGTALLRLRSSVLGRVESQGQLRYHDRDVMLLHVLRSKYSQRCGPPASRGAYVPKRCRAPEVTVL